MPYKLNFQGRLANNAGNIMPDGLYNMKFRIYDAATAGTLQWSEDRVFGSPDYRVQVTNGLFSVQLGDVTALSPNLFTNQNLHFEVELPTPGTVTCATAGCASFSEGPMSPRQKLAAAAYAMNADTLDGIDGANVAQLNQNNTFAGSNLFKTATNSTAALQVQDAAGSSLLNIDSTNLQIQIGSSVADGIGVLLVLDTKNTAGDPTGKDGAMYYNSAAGKFRCYEAAAWTDCLPSGPASAVVSTTQTTTGTAFTNITDLAFNVAANTTYELNCDIVFQTAATTTGIKLGFNGPASPAYLAGQATLPTSLTASLDRNFRAYNAMTASTGVDVANANLYAKLNALYKTGATAGTLAATFGSEIAGSGVSIMPGSVCRVGGY